MAEQTFRLGTLIKRQAQGLLDEWMREQLAAGTRRTDLIREADLRAQSAEFLNLFADAVDIDPSGDVQAAAWVPVRDMLASVSASRTQQGFSSSEVATFVFSFKKPLFTRLRADLAGRPEELTAATWDVNVLLDKLGLYTTEVFQKTREEVISRQQDELLELSTPVVKLWDGILALPMIGTLDSGRTQVVMETLLNRIVETGADIAILDITSVSTVAQHLIKTVTAARLMGADCIISGIRPQIAQTIVHLGVDLKDVVTKANLADAFALAMQRRNLRVVKAPLTKA